MDTRRQQPSRSTANITARRLSTTTVCRQYIIAVSRDLLDVMSMVILLQSLPEPFIDAMMACPSRSPETIQWLASLITIEGLDLFKISSRSTTFPVGSVNLPSFPIIPSPFRQQRNPRFEVQLEFSLFDGHS